jgi:MATE efflux family protein
MTDSESNAGAVSADAADQGNANQESLGQKTQTTLVQEVSAARILGLALPAVGVPITPPLFLFLAPLGVA